MKLGAPACNKIGLSDSQFTNPWIYVTNSRGCLNEGGMNKPIERPGKMGETDTIIFTYVNTVGMSFAGST